MKMLKARKPSRYYLEDYMQDIKDEMNKIFEGMGFMDETQGQETTFKPPTELCEINGNYEVKIQLPGFDKENIDIEVSENCITIKAENTEKKEEKGENIYKSEFRYGKFIRKIPLPSDIQSDKAEAEFKDGILKIAAPKSQIEQEKIKKLTVK